MIKKTINYVDYDGNEQSETWVFNLNKAEVAEMEMSISGGFSNMLKKVAEEKDAPKMFAIFKELILKSVGKKSLDGKRIIKNQDIRDEFYQSEAYSTLFMELVSDQDKVETFVKGIMPAVENSSIPAPKN